MEIRHVFLHTFLARARSPDIYNRAQWPKPRQMLTPSRTDGKNSYIRRSSE